MMNGRADIPRHKIAALALPAQFLAGLLLMYLLVGCNSKPVQPTHQGPLVEVVQPPDPPSAGTVNNGQVQNNGGANKERELSEVPGQTLPTTASTPPAATSSIVKSQPSIRWLPGSDHKRFCVVGSPTRPTILKQCEELFAQVKVVPTCFDTNPTLCAPAGGAAAKFQLWLADPASEERDISRWRNDLDMMNPSSSAAFGVFLIPKSANPDAKALAIFWRVEKGQDPSNDLDPTLAAMGNAWPEAKNIQLYPAVRYLSRQRAGTIETEPISFDVIKPIMPMSELWPASFPDELYASLKECFGWSSQANGNDLQLVLKVSNKSCLSKQARNAKAELKLFTKVTVSMGLSPQFKNLMEGSGAAALTRINCYKSPLTQKGKAVAHDCRAVELWKKMYPRVPQLGDKQMPFPKEGEGNDFRDEQRAFLIVVVPLKEAMSRKKIIWKPELELRRDHLDQQMGQMLETLKEPHAPALSRFIKELAQDFTRQVYERQKPVFEKARLELILEGT